MQPGHEQCTQSHWEKQLLAFPGANSTWETWAVNKELLLFFFFLIQNVFLSLMALEEELNEQHFFGSERHRQAR